ncbi:MAG: hypothetical protein ACRD2C_22510 [Acidimicrobiales bacterium]
MTAGQVEPHKRPGVLAALLNLSGLGAGYLYLRRWLALLHWVGLGLWFGFASSTTPWLVALVAWVGGSVVAAWILGRGSQARALIRRRWVAAGMSVVLAAVVVAAVADHRTAAEAELEAGDEAHAAGDCEAAIRHYDRVTGFYRRSFTTALDRAPVRRGACRSLLDARDSAEGDSLDAAISEYEAYIHREDARFTDGAASELVTARLDYAEHIVADGDPGDMSRYTAAYEQYLLVVEEQPGSPEAEAAPEAVEEMYDEATDDLAADEACDEVEVLEFFASELPGDDGLSDDVVTSATEALPDAEEDCELQRIEDEIADLEADASELPPPTPAGTAPGDSVTVEIVNDSGQGLELLYTGPETGRLEVEPCSDCPDTSLVTPTTCGSADSPRETVTLTAGSYEMVVKATGEEVVTPFYGIWDLDAGTAYSECYYIQSTDFSDSSDFSDFSSST